MAEFQLRPPHRRDIIELGTRMRASDAAELAACNLLDTVEAVQASVRTSSWALTALDGGRVLCIFGVGPLRPHLLLEDTGVPWMLGTDVLREHSRKLMTLTPAYIAQMLAMFPRLENFVHADNHRSIRWLRRLGFRLHEAAPYGPNGAPFHRFEMSRHVQP